MTRIAALLGLLALAGPALAQDANIVETAVGAGSFETLVTAVKAAGLVETLSGEGPFTVFAPNDEAFAALDEGTVEMLLLPENKKKLTSILTYHVVAGKVMAADVKAGEVKSVQGDTLDITIGEDGTVMVDGAKVLSTDVEATNGVIHIIDKVVMPEPPKKAAPPPPPPPEPNIVNVAADNGFSTLVAAVKAAGLVETLSGKGPFTVFAPTDEAFAALGDDAIADLMKPESKDKLAAILTYHVIPGKVMAADISSGKVATVEGSELKIKAKKGTVTVNKATVTKADVETTNGVIHVIDTVLMP